jgi:pimeloyl-ACP methyl ester carboxylesterase
MLGVACTFSTGPVHAADPDRPGVFRASLRTSDGVRATLYRYVPEVMPAPATVLLFPDVGMNRHAFDLRKRGLARYLLNRGVEVFVLEYRGAGRSDAPFGGFSFTDLVERDGEAALARALRERDRVFLAGCGLGGSIAFALAARHPEKVRGVVGLQAAATLDVPNEPIERALAGLSTAAPWADLRALLAGPLYGERTAFNVLLGNDTGTAKDVADDFLARGLSRVPRSLVVEIGGFMRARVVRVGGRDLREIVPAWKGSSLLFFAPRDNWIHSEFATPMRDVLDREKVQVRVLNRVEGASHDYGHLGLLLGSRVEEDVFAPIAGFLREGDGR